MELGFDAKRLFCNFTGLGNYSRTLVNDLHEFYPENRYHLYTGRIPDRPETAQFRNPPMYLAHLPATGGGAWWRTFSVKKQLKSDRISVYHGLSGEIPVNLHRSGIRSIVTVHDLIFKRFPETYQAIDRSVYDWKFRYACRHANRIIAISENTRDEIVHWYGIDPDKIEVIYQACNPIYYQAITATETAQAIAMYNLPDDYLLTVGSIEPRKNLKSLIKAYGLLNKDHRLPLIIVGRGGRYQHEVRELAERTGISGLLHWIDGLSDNRHLKAIYHGARALVYPSWYEGFGLPVAEALLCRTPVIASATSSLKEAGGLHSLYIEPDQPAQIAEAIEKVLTDNALREEMRQSGYRYAQQAFSREGQTQKVMECYRSL